MQAIWALLFFFLAASVEAETVVAARVLRAQTVIGREDLALHEGDTIDAISSLAEAIGKQTRVTLYAGQPLRPADLTPAKLVDRNQLIVLLFRRGNLTITAEGRALSPGAEGDTIRVMNTGSKTTVTATLDASGTAIVGPK